MTNPLIETLTDENFEDRVLNAQGPVLVDYWATWCRPCKSIAPLLDELATEYQGRLKVGKLEIDQNDVTPHKYGIRGIPTLMMFKDGEVIGTKVGVLSRSQLMAFVDSCI